MGGEYGTPPQVGARNATGKLQPETLVHPYLDHVPRPTFQFTSSHIQNTLQQVAYPHSHHCPSAMATAPAEGASDPTLIEVTIEVEHGNEDEDANSTFDPNDGTASDTTSLSSSVSKYRYENGRRYHGYKDGSYLIPNDEKQLNVQDLGNKLHLAPIPEKPQRILDIGTGTGIWAIDMADQYESAEVIGTDLAPTQPTFVPPNCKFEIDDASSEWTFTPNSADLVFFRFMLGCFADWPAVYRGAFKTLKPGGWLEHHEGTPDPQSEDGTVTPDNPFGRWGLLIAQAGQILGKDFAVGYHTKKFMEEVGFINVVEKKYKLPIGRWPADPRMKELGTWYRAYFEDGMEGYAMALLTRVLKWEFLEAQVFFAQLRAAFKDKNIHAYSYFTCVYGQKPPA
ncbi:methyltransferase family protein [Hyaloscypha sp. PMI_1271]|nr:methyltransferase family protein [Hyaloscypha sp. PMI_1271]